MAFSDPQTVIINGATMSIPRTGTGPSSGAFQDAEGNVKLSVSHAVNKRARRTVRIDNQKVAQDPLFPAANVPYSASVYLVVDTPLVGYSVAEQKALVDGLTAYLTASSGARVSQLLGGEN